MLILLVFQTGVVPRTFIPSFILSLMSLPFKLITKSNIFFQILVRLNLAILVILAMLSLSESVRKKFGNYTGSLFIIITCTQFHFIFYSSRTLPNTFALLLVILGFSFWLKKQFTYLIVTSAFCVLIFRFETCIIFGTIFLIELFLKKRINFLYFLSVGVLSGLIAMITTVMFDTLLWGKIIWPELESMYFNLYLNKSHLWGTSPFYWYFLIAVPKLMLFSLPFLALTPRGCVLKFYPVILLHIGLHSLLPHKELRFIIYVAPLLNICAANTIATLFNFIEPAKPDQKKAYINELNKVYDAKDFSSYRTFQKDELKELEKIRPKENLLRKRKLNNDGKNLVVTEYLICEGYDYLKSISKSNNFNNLNNLNNLNELLDDGGDKERATKSDERRPDKATSSKDDGHTTLKMFVQYSYVVLHFCLNFAVSTFILFISFYNYPGGDAVIWLNDNIPKHLSQFNLNASQVGVHVGNLAAQTGFTRFAEWESIAYDKSPSFLPLTTGESDESLRRLTGGKGQSLNVDLTRYKLVYLILDDVKPDLLNQYCHIIKQSGQPNKLPYSIDKFECNFNRLKRCRVNSVIYGFHSVHLKLDSKFLNITKVPLLYIYR